MIFYTADHLPEAILDHEKQKSTRQNGSFQGFFLADRLNAILDQNKKKDKKEKCVGIRFYNAGGLAEKDHRLIAVGLNERGEEIVLKTNGARYSLSATDPQLPVEEMNRVEATHAVWEAKKARKDSSRITFASYFSRKMIEELLAPKNGLPVDGISFYIVPQEPAGTGNEHTHLGVPSILVKGKGKINIKPLENPEGDLSISYIRSDLTCPKYCVAPVDSAAGSKTAAQALLLNAAEKENFRIADQAILTNPRYLNVWD